MEDAKAKELLRAILDSVGGWTGRPTMVKDLALRLGISHEEAYDLVQELINSGLAWATIEEGRELIWQNCAVGVSKKGRHFVDGFPDPHPDMWANAPAPTDNQ
jgi:hypothetical protein